MSLHRAILFAIAAMFTAGMTSVASAGYWGFGSAGCCGWGVSAPIAYASVGCGGCNAPTAAIIYAQPVAPAPVPVIVSTWGTGWNTGCGCQGPVVYAAPVLEPTPIAPAPIYVVNQGPEYAGPGLMVPYRTWSPAAAYGPASEYPYIPGYGHGYGYRYGYGHHYGYGPHYGYGYGHRHGYGYGYGYGRPAYYPHRFYGRPAPRFAYRERMFAHPRYYGPRYYRPMPRWRPYPHRPLGVRR
jgi:hypothetical protein